MARLVSWKLKVFFASFMVGCVFFLFFGERFLQVHDDEGQKADAVVVLAGSQKEDMARLREGVGLVREGRADYLILPLRYKSLRWSWLVKHYQIEANISQDKIYIGRGEGVDKKRYEKFGGTYSEAQETIRIMAQRNLASAIIVSSPYHMRRAKMAFEKSKIGYPLHFFYHAVQKTSYEQGPWWLDKVRFSRVLSEYPKLIAGFFVYQ